MEDVLDFIRPAKLLPGSAGCMHRSGYRGAGENNAGKAPDPVEVTFGWGGAKSRLEGETCQGPAKLSARHLVSPREWEPHPLIGCKWSRRRQEGRRAAVPAGRVGALIRAVNTARPAMASLPPSPSEFQPEGGLRFSQPASLWDTTFAAGAILPHLSP